MQNILLVCPSTRLGFLDLVKIEATLSVASSYSLISPLPFPTARMLMWGLKLRQSASPLSRIVDRISPVSWFQVLTIPLAYDAPGFRCVDNMKMRAQGQCYR